MFLRKFTIVLKISVVLMITTLFPTQSAHSADACEITAANWYYQSFGCCAWASGISCSTVYCSCFDEPQND
jgi:hypothetical protein